MRDKGGRISNLTEVKKSIYLLTWNGSTNYGTNLQAYALKTYIESLGLKCYMFSGDGKMSWVVIRKKIYRRVKKYWNTYFQRRSEIEQKFKEQLKQKEKRIQLYIEENFLNVKINRQSKFCSIPNESIFLVGSDQVWNPYYLDTTMLLDFLPDKFVRSSYATSVSVPDIPKELVYVYSKNLLKFSFISVREIGSKDTLEKSIPELQGKVQVVPDPTFLLNDTEWMRFAEKCIFFGKNDLKPNEYILCYFVGKHFNYEAEVNQIKKYYKKPVYAISETAEGLALYGIPIADAGPVEFVWLIQNANIVLTDSFHAIALSINLKKEFIAFKRFEDTDKKSQNFRIYNLLDEFCLKERLYTNEKDVINMCNHLIAYNDVSATLWMQRKKGVGYLANILS